MALDERLNLLLSDLKQVHEHLRAETRDKYRRINPFSEDLFDWKERGEYWLGEDRNVTIYNSTTLVGEVSIGKNTWVGPFCSLDGTGGLTIGESCSISLGCQLLSHDTVKWSLSGGVAPYEYAPIRIGDCCFLGVYSVVLKSVTIGDHCLIAAGAVVTKDVPSYSIVAGVPARTIGKVVIGENGEVELQFDKDAPSEK
jgi:acetyltransferase-like isoleucine patch superfamily enzyme